MTVSEIAQRLTELEDLVESILEKTTSGKRKQVKEIEPWTYGAEVLYEDGSRERLSMPPKVSRFKVRHYNKIVKLINNNSELLANAS